MPGSVEVRASSDDPYVTSPRQRSRAWVAFVAACTVFCVALIWVGPGPVGTLIDRLGMASFAVLTSALTLGVAVARTDRHVRFTWTAYGLGIGIYAAAFVLDAAWTSGCAGCGGLAAGLAAGAWVILVSTLAGAMRLAFVQAQRRQLLVEMIDAAVVLLSVATLLGLLHEVGVLRSPEPLWSSRTVELAGVPLLAAGMVFVRRCVGDRVTSYRRCQLLFLASVAGWVTVSVAEAGSSRWAQWGSYAALRSITAATAVGLPLYAVKEGEARGVLAIEGPEERPITDITVAAGMLGLVVLASRLFGERETVIYKAAPQVLTVVTLLVVVRLILTTRQHRATEAMLDISSRRHRDLVEGAAYGLLELDRYGHIVYCNEAVAKIFGIPRSELLGKPIAELLGPVFWTSTGSTSPLGVDDAELPQTSRAIPEGADPWEELRKGKRVVVVVGAPSDPNARRGDDYSDRVFAELVPSRKSGRAAIGVVMRDVTSEATRRIRVLAISRELQYTERERAELIRDLLEAAESERYSLASQLHDGPVQSLALLALKVDLLRKNLVSGGNGRRLSEVRSIREEVDRHLADLRSRVAAMRPLEANAKRLHDSVRQIFSGVVGSALGEGVRWEVAVDESIEAMPKLVLTALFRAVQGIAYDARMIGARAVKLVLRSEGRELAAIFSADAPLEVRRHHGVARAKAWVEKLGGSFVAKRSDGVYVVEMRFDLGIAGIDASASPESAGS